MGFSVDPQPMYIWDAVTNEILFFDGVIKAEHNASLKIEDDPDAIKRDKNATGYYNNARNEGNEIVFDVVMSPVYTSSPIYNASANAFVANYGDRSATIYQRLMKIKQDRTPVLVVTTLMTYAHMLIKSIQVLQDENNPWGFEGAITFHEIIQQTGQSTAGSTQASALADNGSGGGRTPSVWVDWLGANAI